MAVQVYYAGILAVPPLSSSPPEPQPAAASADPAAPDPIPNPPAPPESEHYPRRWPGLDRLGVTQALGGFAVGLIALLSSYDHITFFGHTFPLPQQWGIPFIAASVAIIFIDAQLATRSRLRAAQDTARAADETARERNFASEERQKADRERDRADRERNRAAEARERQRSSFARLDRSALLSARVQLDPSESNRARLQAFLALIGGPSPSEEEGI